MDKKLNEVSTLTDFDYALIIKGTDVAKVSKDQLASVLGVTIKTLRLDNNSSNLLKISINESWNLYELIITTDVATYIGYIICSSANLSYNPSYKKIYESGESGVSTSFYKDNSNNLFVKINTGSYGARIICKSKTGSIPYLSVQSSTDTSSLTNL